jgi:hypothetical protein
MSPDNFEMAKQEYIKLKNEQTKRIGFRDNLLYVNRLLISRAFHSYSPVNTARTHGKSADYCW